MTVRLVGCVTIEGVTEDEFKLTLETDAVHPPDRIANTVGSETRFKRLKV
jgi:hypothetical protein